MSIYRKNHIIFRENKASWKLIFPIICFCIALGILYDCYETILNLKPQDSFIGVFLGWTFASMLFVILGTVFGMERDQHFDVLLKRFKIVKRVGVFGIGSWQKYKTLDYVSTHRNADGQAQINLWYDSINHFSVSTHYSEEIAVNRGERLAKQLEIDFHDGMRQHEITYEDDSAQSIPNDERTIDAYLSQGNRPLWQTIIAAILFTASFVIIYYFLSGVNFSDKRLGIHPYILQIPAYLIIIGISLSVVNDYLFDIENMQYKVVHNLGPIRWGKWRSLKTIDYVSVFKKNDRIFLVNIWFNTNKHMTVSASASLKEAIDSGKKVAKKLKIDVVDASDPHHKKWIEID